MEVPIVSNYEILSFSKKTMKYYLRHSSHAHRRYKSLYLLNRPEAPGDFQHKLASHFGNDLHCNCYMLAFTSFRQTY